MSDDFSPPHGMGMRPDTPDRRDRLLYAAVPSVAALAEKVNLSALMPDVYDQGAVGSCTGWSCAQTMHAIMRKDGHRRPYMPSPVFLYREARDLEGEVQGDAGAQIRDTFKAANKLGLPPMTALAPQYDAADLPDPDTALFPEKSIWRRKPPASIYKRAETRQLLTYFRLAVLPDLLRCLADGYPCNIGFDVYRSFYGPQGPVRDVPDPQPGERVLGGHAVVAIGYDLAAKRIILRNQWGQTAHEGGPDFTLSFDFMQQHSDDWWTARLIEGGKA